MQDTEEVHLPPKPHNGSRMWMNPIFGITLGIIIVIGIAFGVISTVFHRAQVTVTLRTLRVPVSGTFEASPTGTTLAFATKTDTETLSKTVPSTGSEHVSEVASGTITITNTGATSQKLIATTRFAAANGHIYRIKAAVTVPAKKSVDAPVYADQPGDSYNLAGPADFTVPGLKGSPQFTAVTGHLMGSIAGGFVGDHAVVSTTDHTQAVTDLSKQLTNKAQSMLTASLGPDDLVFPNSITVVITTDPDQPAQGGAAVTVHATASAPVFSMAAVAHLIASEGGSTDMGPLVVSNLSDLNPSVAPSKTPQNMTLSLSGTATLVGSYDKATLIKSLAGKNRKDIGSQLGAYPGIADMKISVYPFWSTTLPSDPAKISITEVRHAAP